MKRHVASTVGGRHSVLVGKDRLHRPLAAEQALLELAIERHAAGDFAQADALYGKLVRLNRRNAEALHRWALLKQAHGELHAALDLLDRVIPLNPADPGAHCHRGYVLHDLGRRQEAAASLRRALQRSPRFVDALIALGVIEGELGAYDAARTHFDRALALDPYAREAVLNKGALFENQNLLEEAVATFDAGLRSLPADTEMLHRKISCLHRLGRLGEALDVSRVRLAVRPEGAAGLTSMANTLRALGRLEDALQYHQRALVSPSTTPDDVMDAAMAHLAAGDLLIGFRLYETRWKTDRCAFKLDANHQPWGGEPDIAGRTILVWSDEGIGDTIQFVRFVPRLAARGARVILEAQPMLVPLLSCLEGVDEVVAQGAPLPRFDLCCPIMSLPVACEVTLSALQGGVSYLHADVARRAHWRARLNKLDGLRVGLCWAGSQKLALDRRRSMPPMELAPLPEVPGISLISLQKDWVGDHGLALQDWTNELSDFADTAALISELDLVISVDTAVAHIAGALGKPVWLLNRVDPCWRWLHDRDDTPWYPTMRLFRQPSPNNWQPVVASVCELLRNWHSTVAPALRDSSQA